MTENRRPAAGSFYRHFKNRLYQVLHIAVHADTEEELVIYQALYGDFRVYARPLADFVSEVDHEKYPQARQRYRFEQVSFEELTAQPKKTHGFKASALREEEGVWEAGRETAPKPRHLEEPGEPEKAVWDSGEPEQTGGVHPLLLAFLDADSYEERLKIFMDMEDEADMHMLDAVAASLDITLGGSRNLAECIELIRDNLITQKKFECSRWR